MAKHDQRILKFLTQNAERAPTITDMMTRLNISISDISDSLNSLLSQGLISKRTNGQGIECWFPLNGSPQPMAPAENRPVDMNRRSGDAERRPDESRILAGLNHPSPPEPSPLPPLQPTLPSLSASNAFPASLTAPAPAPQLSPRPAGRESAVFTATPAAGAAGTASPAPAAAVSTPPAGAATAQPGLETLPGVPAPVPFNLAPVKTGVGFLTFAAGLILAAGAAVYFSGRLVKRDLETASRNFAEKPALDKALASMSAFESSAKLQLGALDIQVKELKARVDSLKSANDSLMAVAESARKAEAPPKKAVTKRRR